MDNDFILVVDLGGPEAVAMALKLRYQRYYTEVISGADTARLLRKQPKGILITGGETASADAFPREALSLGVPVLAMGAAARLMAIAAGGQPLGIWLRDSSSQITFKPCDLFDQLSDSDRYFARIDGISMPEGFQPIAATSNENLVPAFGDFQRNLYGLQFYAEPNDPDGSVILSNFAEKICNCAQIWDIPRYAEEEIQYLRGRIGSGKALMAVSGGLDSTACALLVQKAIGDQLSCVFVDNGLLREGEREVVLNTFRDALNMNLTCIDASERFLNRLRGVTDPGEKHAVIHSEFINVLSEVREANPGIEYMIQGTIYTDLLGAAAASGDYGRKFDAGTLIEPLRMLFKPDVEDLGAYLGLPQTMITRQSFPSPGLAIRCLGEVTQEKLALLRKADAIFRDEVQKVGQDKRLSRYFAVLTDAQAIGQRSGAPSREYVCALRAVSQQGPASFTVGRLPHDLLERAALRITEEVRGISRVVYDVTGSLHGQVEWE